MSIFLVILPVVILPVSFLSADEVSLTISKTSGSANPSLVNYGSSNFVPGIRYPDWFADPKLTSSDRDYLVTRYNQREWLLFQSELNENSDPKKIQPILDLLEALGGALNPESSQVNAGSKDAGVIIKPRDGFEQDQPSELETPGDPTIEVIDKELRWYSRKYDIPPSLVRDSNYRPTTIGPASQPSKQLSAKTPPAQSQQDIQACIERVNSMYAYASGVNFCAKNSWFYDANLCAERSAREQRRKAELDQCKR